MGSEGAGFASTVLLGRRGSRRRWRVEGRRYSSPGCSFLYLDTVADHTLIAVRHSAVEGIAAGCSLHNHCYKTHGEGDLLRRSSLERTS